jgi:hypothetical protein
MRWLDDVETDSKKMGVKGWKEKLRDREQWKLVVEEAKAHPGLSRLLAGRHKAIFPHLLLIRKEGLLYFQVLRSKYEGDYEEF